MFSGAVRRAMSTSVKATGELVKYEVNAATKVGTITLNDPTRLNALTEKMGDELTALVSKLQTDVDVGAIVLRGSGTAFSAGGDLDFLRRRSTDTGDRNAYIMRAFYERFLCIRKIPVPVVSAINGAAVGAGLALAMATDYRVAAASARMGVTFTRLGLHPGMGSTHFLSKVMGPEQAAFFLLTGDLVSGEEAHRRGMVAEIVHGSGEGKQKATEESEGAIARAHEVAARMASAAPVAVRAATRSLRLQQDEHLDRALWREADAQSYSYSTQDLKNGVDAVANKKAPYFNDFHTYRDN